MRIINLRSLSYEGNLMGLRFYLDNGDMWDLEASKLENAGFGAINLGRPVEMYAHYDKLLTNEERRKKKQAIDISGNYMLQDRIRQIVRKTSMVKELANFEIEFIAEGKLA